MTETIPSLDPQDLGFWKLGIGIYLRLGAWNLEFDIWASGSV
jgi:hypothetical protein